MVRIFAFPPVLPTAFVEHFLLLEILVGRFGLLAFCSAIIQSPVLNRAFLTGHVLVEIVPEGARLISGVLIVAVASAFNLAIQRRAAPLVVLVEGDELILEVPGRGEL